MKGSLLLGLFVRFLKIGIVGFGGGWAILPIIRREIVEEAGWLSDEEYMDLVAIAGSTPGPIAVNAATYVGFRLAGVAGAAVATLAVILPPFTAISLIVYLLSSYLYNRVVQAVLKGLKAAVVGLIVLALYSTVKNTLSAYRGIWDTLIYIGIIVSTIILVEVLRLHPLIALGIAIIVGLVLGLAGVW